ncbi:hypothetical protein F8B43_1419 [Methylorubrum populi]|uniref:Uncharacterized protein n=1 Tax=Methylorubrum populi TaxID=223967 RepID=A0A833J7A2_9HYPH|nr:hypothetical protein F8B43_1419 [Methylorubrum populi]
MKIAEAIAAMATQTKKKAMPERKPEKMVTAAAHMTVTIQADAVAIAPTL